MGKSRRKRDRPHSTAPTGLPSMKDVGNEEESVAAVSGTVANLVEKLQSPSAEERECTCAIIASLVEQVGSVPQFLKAQVPKVLGPLLLDQSWTLRKTAVGALRNISVDGGISACEDMVRQDVMTPLVALFQQYENDWTPADASKLDIQGEVFDHALNLLWNLCEVSDIACKIFNQNNLMNRLLPCVNYEKFGYSISIAAAECLYTVTDGNSPATSFFSNVENRSILENLLKRDNQNSHQLLLQTLCTGILFNCSFGGSADFQSIAIRFLSNVLSQNTSGVLIAADAMYRSVMEKSGPLDAECAMTESVSANTHDDCGNESEKNGPLGEENEQIVKHTALEKQIEEASHVLSAQQIALQLVTNLCCDGDESEDQWEDSSDTSHDELTDVVEEEMDETNAANWSSLCVPGEIHSALVSHEIVQKVMSKIEAPESDLCERLSSRRMTQRLTRSLDELMRSALLCLTNLVTGLEVQELGGFGQLHELWARLVHMTAKQNADDEMIEAITSLMHATVLKLKLAASPKLQELTTADMEFLYKLSSSSKMADVRANCVRIVSAIGQSLSTQIQPHAMMKPIGEYLLQMIRIEKELWVVAEAVDAIMDVFAEDHLNQVLIEVDMLPTLTSMMPHLKTKVKQEKRSLGEHLPVVMIVKTNLSRFIQYKAKVMGVKC